MLAKTLKKLRENCGLTQQQVADAINLERSTYAYYETGKTIPSIDTIVQLAKIFNVSYSDILESEAQPKTYLFSDVPNSEHISTKKQEAIYSLSKTEKTLICYFRALSRKEQNQFLKDIIERFTEEK